MYVIMLLLLIWFKLLLVDQIEPPEPEYVPPASPPYHEIPYIPLFGIFRLVISTGAFPGSAYVAEIISKSVPSVRFIAA